MPHPSPPDHYLLTTVTTLASLFYTATDASSPSFLLATPLSQATTILAVPHHRRNSSSSSLKRLSLCHPLLLFCLLDPVAAASPHTCTTVQAPLHVLHPPAFVFCRFVTIVLAETPSFCLMCVALSCSWSLSRASTGSPSINITAQKSRHQHCSFTAA